ncbi:MAG: hypothetical protein ABW252_25625 [Polyangiales bacterium]
MIAKLNALALLVGGLTVLPTEARAADACTGPWVEVDADADEVIWGPESRCECGSMRAGLLASSKQVGWFWTQDAQGTRGSGVAWVQLQVIEDASDRVGAVTPMRRSENTQWLVVDSGGMEGVMSIPQNIKGWRWNGVYRVQCLDL